MSAHTPGPWKVEDHTVTHSKFALRIVSNERDIDIADLNCDGTDREAKAATKADASLIAAAPEMYEALKAVVEQLRVAKFDGPWLDHAKAAIDKAEGKP